MRPINKLYWFEQLGDWAPKLKPVLTDSEYISKLFTYLANEMNRTQVFPAFNDIFKAFNMCQYKDLKVVIFGLQPTPFLNNYDNTPLSNGLAYGNHLKPFNMCIGEVEQITSCVEREMYNGLKFDTDNELTTWANQGVLLLNCALTSVREKKGLHLKPWEKFTKFVVQTINNTNSGIIFCLWGKEMQQLRPLINEDLHYVLVNELSPIDSLKQNIDWQCNHFKEVNKILKTNNNYEIKW